MLTFFENLVNIFVKKRKKALNLKVNSSERLTGI